MPVSAARVASNWSKGPASVLYRIIEAVAKDVDDADILRDTAIDVLTDRLKVNFENIEQKLTPVQWYGETHEDNGYTEDISNHRTMHYSYELEYPEGVTLKALWKFNLEKWWDLMLQPIRSGLKQDIPFSDVVRQAMTAIIQDKAAEFTRDIDGISINMSDRIEEIMYEKNKVYTDITTTDVLWDGTEKELNESQSLDLRFRFHIIKQASVVLRETGPHVIVDLTLPLSISCNVVMPNEHDWGRR